jgi:hypothetical protein
MTTIDQITAILTNAGYRNHGRRTKGFDLHPMLFQRSVDASPCHCNDKTYINVWAYDHIDGDLRIESISVEMVGQADADNWVSLEFYGITRDQLLADGAIKDFEIRLIAAWEAVYLKVPT